MDYNKETIEEPNYKHMMKHQAAGQPIKSDK
jgi:hypothetical protein